MRGSAKSQSGGALAGMLDRVIDPLKGFLGEDAVVTEALELEQPADRRVERVHVDVDDFAEAARPGR